MLTIADLARASERVFPTHARVERYYPAAAAEEARAILGRCLDRGEGPTLLIGAPGTGKSMLLEVLADDLGKQRPVVCLTSAQLCTRRALLQSILFELGQSYRQRDEGDLRLTLFDYLSGGDVRRTGVLLLVDEAQTLPIRLLEELRVLGNVSHQGVPTVRLLLAGSQSLEETFTEPAIEAFNQRIVARCYLAPLSHYDTAQFVRGHLAAAGASPDDTFTADALDAVYRATDGIARLVNQVCDRALVLAARHGKMQVTKDIVEGAWADLQQLPTPWNLPDSPVEADCHADDAEQVVEFGPLSEDHDGLETLSTNNYANDHEDTPPPARMYEPECDEPHADGTALTAKAREHAMVMPSGSVADDLFGSDFEEEEVLIDDYAPLEQAIPASRPRVTSACEAELGKLLHAVTRKSSADPESADDEVQPVSVAEEFDPPFPSFSVVDDAELDETPMDATELDDEEAEGLAGEVKFECHESPSLAVPQGESVPAAAEGNWLPDDIDILVIDDEMSIPINTVTAQRADYRQLFKALRNN